jgi:hypothetical protein
MIPGCLVNSEGTRPCKSFSTVAFKGFLTILS